MTTPACTPIPLSGRKNIIFLLLRKVCNALSSSGLKLLYEYYVCYILLI